MVFLNDHAFTTPMFLVDREILRRIEPVGVLDRIRTSQARVLRTVMSGDRLARLVEQEAIDGDVAYAPTDFLADLRGGLWRELDEAEVAIDAYRRNVQRTYLDLIDDQLNGRSPAEDDTRPFLRGELRALDGSIAAALAQVSGPGDAPASRGRPGPDRSDPGSAGPCARVARRRDEPGVR